MASLGRSAVLLITVALVALGIAGMGQSASGVEEAQPSSPIPSPAAASSRRG
jgi:hypothetical protein